MNFNPLAILRILSDEGVEFVVIGGIAASALGSPTATVDVDICYRRAGQNIDRLAKALEKMSPRLRGVDEEVPFVPDARTLAAGDHFTFTTNQGDLDVFGEPAGTTGYEDLASDAVTVDLDGLTVKVASLRALIAMKRAAGRGKDLAELHILIALREELEG
jgi:hypothetical protein